MANDIIDISRKNYADRDLAVVGAVGCVEGPAAIIEADLSP